MKNLFRGFGIIAVLFMAGATRVTSGAPGDLLVLHYVLHANVASTTGFRTVYGAPASVRRFKILETGNYCDIVVDSVEYTTQPGGYAQRAYHGVDGYEVPEGSIYAISINFEQRTWNNAQCDISVSSVDGGNGNHGDGIWFDVLTIQDLAGAQPDYTARCGRELRESLPGVQCYGSVWANELICKDPQTRKSLLQRFSCVRTVNGPTLEPATSIKWNQPL